MTREEAIQILKSMSDISTQGEAIDIAIEALQTDAVQGEWIDENGNNVPLHKDGYPLRSCYCNQCHEWLVASDEYEVKGNFCPNCGADMRGAEKMKLPQDRILHIDTELKDGKVNIVAEWQGELVRCKECRYLDVWNLKNIYAVCSKHSITFEPFEDDTRTHFCSWGERREP